MGPRSRVREMLMHINQTILNVATITYISTPSRLAVWWMAYDSDTVLYINRQIRFDNMLSDAVYATLTRES